MNKQPSDLRSNTTCMPSVLSGKVFCDEGGPLCREQQNGKEGGGFSVSPDKPNQLRPGVWQMS